VAIGFALAVTMLLLAAREAGAAKYAVAQCGWRVGADADWADTTGGAKFRPDAWCVPPPGADAFDGVHVKSFTRDAAATVWGNRFARWRWLAPPTTGITRVSGTWWHALHDGMQQRLGVVNGGGFTPFATAGATDVALRGFTAGISPPAAGFEDRLLCARAKSKWCSLAATSWSAVRALTIIVQDDVPPAAGVSGALVSGGWRRGNQGIGFWGNDAGAGVHSGETTLDGARVALTEYPCAKAMIGGEWRGTKMQPCLTVVSGGATVDTTRFSDGTHMLGHCASDFAGNVACTAGRTVGIDNNPPAAPRKFALAGGEGWRRANDFDFSWTNPDQGPASPIWGAYWRILGPAGFDSGTELTGGRGVERLADRTVPRPGVYKLRLWLRDEAGNSRSSNDAEATLRLDYVAPGVAFEPVEEQASSEPPDKVVAAVFDEHSGPARGEVRYQRLGADRWSRLPTALERGEEPGRARLVASVPDGLKPGTYLFRAEAADGAGNSAVSTRRADGTQMAVRVPSAARPVSSARRPSATTPGRARPRAKTRILARLRRGRRRGRSVTAPFGAGARLGGRLLTAKGTGLAGRQLRVVSRFSHGSFRRKRIETVRTGRRGGFRLDLPPGPSRRVAVRFRGAPGFAPSGRAGMLLRVRGGLSFGAEPRALRRGETVRLRGRVRSRGAPLPRRGKLVAIQYFESEARRWRPVLVTRSDHGGRFRARYRFRYVSGRATIRLRAVALPEERWPYAPGASPPLIVRVSG
jgi:hypothetical protein